MLTPSFSYPGEAAEIEPCGQLTRGAKQMIGYKCKRLLDLARIQFLEQNGYTCALKYYVKPDVTLENICLVGQLQRDDDSKQ